MAEEIDDDSVIDNWEDFEENPTALDKHLKKMTITNKGPANRMGEIIIVNEEEAQRSSTFNSQEPKIMILRRPPKVTEQVGLPNGNVLQKQKAQTKSLQQRQAEYAEARLRILGNAGSATEELKKSENFDDTQMQINPTAYDISLSQRAPLMSVASSGNSKPVAFIKPTTSVNVLRSPRGPDSNFGFQGNSGKNGPS